MTTENETVENRRKIPRYPRHVDIAVRDEQSRLLPEKPKLLDISPYGIGLQVSEDVEPGRKLQFSMALPTGKVSGVAVIRWSAPNEFGYHCGLSIEDISWADQYRLREFLVPSRFLELTLSDNILTAFIGAVISAYLVRASGMELAMPREIFWALTGW